MKYSLCDQHICSKWWLHGWVVSKYIIIILPSIHGNTFSLMSLFKNLTYTASDTSVLTLLQSTAFHIMAPRNLMPVLPKSDVTAGMWKWSADLVSWLWYSLFLWNKDKKKILEPIKTQFIEAYMRHQVCWAWLVPKDKARVNYFLPWFSQQRIRAILIRKRYL